MNKVFRFIFVFLFVTIIGVTSLFAKKGNLTGILPTKGLLKENIVYKQTPLGPQRLDIYLPDTSINNTPVVVFIHGGSWMHGNKDEITYHFQAQMLKRMLAEGFSVISINYRLINDSLSVRYPEPLSDCKDAIRWVRAHSKTYGWDANNIAVMGTSAGGHLAMLTAYTPDDIVTATPELSTISAKTKCVVDIYGPTQIAKLLHPTFTPLTTALASLFFSQKTLKMRDVLLWSFTGYGPTHPYKRKKVCKQYSPLEYCADAVPTIVFHGNRDSLVPYRQTKLLNKTMKKYGKEIEVNIIDGQNHSFPTVSANVIEKMCDELIFFLNKQLR